MSTLEFFKQLRRRAFLIAVVTAAAALLGCVVAFLMPSVYSASGAVYVAVVAEGSAGVASQDSLDASQQVASDVAQIMGSSTVQVKARERLNAPHFGDYGIRVESLSGSRVIILSVEGRDPEACAQVCNALIECAEDASDQLLGIRAMRVVDWASVPTKAVGPDRLAIVLTFAFSSLLAVVMGVFLIECLNHRVRGADELKELVDLPILCRMPEMCP